MTRSPVRMAHQPRYPRVWLLAEGAVLAAGLVLIVAAMSLGYKA